MLIICTFWRVELLLSENDPALINSRKSIHGHEKSSGCHKVWEQEWGLSYLPFSTCDDISINESVKDKPRKALSFLLSTSLFREPPWREWWSLSLRIYFLQEWVTENLGYNTLGFLKEYSTSDSEEKQAWFHSMRPKKCEGKPTMAKL